MGADPGAPDLAGEIEVGFLVNRSIAIDHFDAAKLWIFYKHLAE